MRNAGMHEDSGKQRLFFNFFFLPGFLFLQAGFIFTDKCAKLGIIVFFKIGRILKRAFRMLVGHKIIFLARKFKTLVT